MKHQFSAVCIPPYYVKDASIYLKDSATKIVTVIGYPMGYSATAAKVEEIKRAINEGADELDIVINVCAIKDNKWAYVRNDIDTTTRSAHLKGKKVSLILEANYLTESELKKLCIICEEVGVDFVKNATSMKNDDKVLDIIQFLKKELSAKTKIKIFTSLSNQIDVNKLIEAGVDRLVCFEHENLFQGEKKQI